MKKLNIYEVDFKKSSGGIAKKIIKAVDEMDVIDRLEARHYRTELIENIRKIEI